MLSEPSGILWLVVAAIYMPGVGLLLLAKFGFSRSTAVGADRLRGIARKLGIAFVALTGLLCLYLLPVLMDGPRSGGLGSAGDPFGAFLMMGYLFVLAPLAVIASVIVGIVYLVQRQRTRS